MNADNKALHRTTIPLRSKIAGELGVILKGRKGSTAEGHVLLAQLSGVLG